MILILGGTGEARELAFDLDDRGTSIVSSLAGRVARPRLPVGDARVGGFGGVTGLCQYLAEADIRGVVDATHPFAEGMSANALAACTASGIPLLRLERPGWAEAPGSDAWHWVDDHDGAAAETARLGSRPFLTVGRQGLGHFTGPIGDRAALVRVVDEPEIELPAPWEVILSRGPYVLTEERDILRRHRADVLVTKDSGGSYTWPKMEAAAALDVPVVIVRRGAMAEGLTVVHTVSEAVAWVTRLS